jgi:uncharacterized protein YllA (UPF0747 family)
MERFGFKFEDLFRGLDGLLPQVIDEGLGQHTAKVFAMAEEGINIELNRLDQELSQIDPTLAENLATRRRKIIYHIEALRNKARRAQLEKDETAHRRLQSLFAALLPNAGLQERSLNVTYFLNRYGPGFIDLIYNSIDLDDRSHRLVYI